MSGLLPLRGKDRKRPSALHPLTCVEQQGRCPGPREPRPFREIKVPSRNLAARASVVARGLRGSRKFKRSPKATVQENDGLTTGRSASRCVCGESENRSPPRAPRTMQSRNTCACLRKTARVPKARSAVPKIDACYTKFARWMWPTYIGSMRLGALVGAISAVRWALGNDSGFRMRGPRLRCDGLSSHFCRFSFRPPPIWLLQPTAHHV